MVVERLHIEDSPVPHSTAAEEELVGAVADPFGDAWERLLPILADLHEATREAVQLSVRRGTVARVVEGVYDTRSAELTAGYRTPLPLHCTAAGKVLLAGATHLLPDLCEQGLHAHTPATITSGRRLLAELVTVQRFGIAVDHGEWEAGLTGVAAPVRVPGRGLMGAISVVGPAGRLVPDVVAQRLGRAAKAASRELRATGFAATGPGPTI